MKEKTVRVGVVGCGGFALFALQQFIQVEGVELVGMAGTYPEPAEAAARRFGIPDFGTIEQMLARDDLDLVYIATPPFLHHPQAMEALQAGRHVICEKPLALTLKQADQMIEAARKRDLLLAANLMQRYNVLCGAIRGLLRSGALGSFLHGYFENYAADESLPPDHWFWDRARSGGIFVEHGVHFFDLFEGWLGPGEVVAAQAGMRPGGDIEEQVQCTVRYDSGALVNFYHGFHQPHRLDRQEMRLVFERGDVLLEGWVPASARIHAIADETDTRRLCELFPGARLDVTAGYGPEDRACRARHKDLDVYQLFEMTWGAEHRKMHLYGELLRRFIRDQVCWIRDRSHKRLITEHNGRRSLELALEADRLAHQQPEETEGR